MAKTKTSIKKTPNITITPQDEEYLKGRLKEIEKSVGERLKPEAPTNISPEAISKQPQISPDLNELVNIANQMQNLINTQQQHLDQLKEQWKQYYAQYPKPPELKEIPEPPIRERFDTYRDLNNLGKLFTSLAIISTTILGMKSGVPEAGLIAYAEMLRAFREQDNENFKYALQDWINQVDKIKDYNSKLLQEYQLKLQEYAMKGKGIETLSELDMQKFNLAYKNLDLAYQTYQTITDMLAKQKELELKEMKNYIEIQKALLEIEKKAFEIKYLLPLDVEKKKAEIQKLYAQMQEIKTKIALLKEDQKKKAEQSFENILNGLFPELLPKEQTKEQKPSKFKPDLDLNERISEEDIVDFWYKAFGYSSTPKATSFQNTNTTKEQFKPKANITFFSTPQPGQPTNQPNNLLELIKKVFQGK